MICIPLRNLLVVTAMFNTYFDIFAGFVWTKRYCCLVFT